MAIQYHPTYPGSVLKCDFSRGFVPPEMVKVRPVVVVSKKASASHRLCTVIPLSTTAPNTVKAWHVELSTCPIPDEPPHTIVWAKCDMIYTVSYDRLQRYHIKTYDGRQYQEIQIPDADMKGISAGILAYLAHLA